MSSLPAAREGRRGRNGRSRTPERDAPLAAAAAVVGDGRDGGGRGRRRDGSRDSSGRVDKAEEARVGVRGRGAGRRKGSESAKGVDKEDGEEAAIADKKAGDEGPPKKDEGSEEDICSVCQCCRSPADVGRLGCGHSFCFPCISKWAKQRNECPVCREVFLKIPRRCKSQHTMTLRSRTNKSSSASSSSAAAAAGGAGGGDSSSGGASEWYEQVVTVQPPRQGPPHGAAMGGMVQSVVIEGLPLGMLFAFGGGAIGLPALMGPIVQAMIMAELHDHQHGNHAQGDGNAAAAANNPNTNGSGNGNGEGVGEGQEGGAESA
uniref:RING-type domain-containing protein n=1 Tax=Vitrella brassicaformis TaxID=1169539 RepID=A0A7S1K8Z1_9ALVE|mmetsp:Transcript_4363/g.9993  ORF Transcript_4363/g.9993 Transcript_4363/m.9993 type:complete len:319 (+) Transcript_4363:97-1053(+)